MACRKNRAVVLWIGVFTLSWMVPTVAGQQAEPKVLTLQQAESMALENHPGIHAASERIKVQEALLGRVRAGYYPTFGVRGTYENRQTDNPMADKNLQTTTGQVDWLVSDFGRREGTIRREEDTLESRRFTRETSVEEVVFMVRRTFFDYLRAQALVRVEQDTVKDREALVRQARGFFDVGTRPKIDVARAEAGLFAAKAGLIAAQNGVRIAWARLKGAMGVTRFEERPVATDVNVQAPVLSLQEAVRTASESRTELKDFQSRLAAQQEAIEVAKQGRMPRLRLSGQYGRRWHNDTDIVSSMLTLDIPLFAGFTVEPEIERNVRDYAVIAAQREEQRQHIALEVEESYLNLEEAGERIKANEAQKKSAKENLELANGRYQVGVGSIIEITEAQGDQQQGSDRPHTVRLRSQGGRGTTRPRHGPGLRVQPVVGLSALRAGRSRFGQGLAGGVGSSRGLAIPSRLSCLSIPSSNPGWPASAVSFPAASLGFLTEKSSGSDAGGRGASPCGISPPSLESISPSTLAGSPGGGPDACSSGRKVGYRGLGRVSSRGPRGPQRLVDAFHDRLGGGRFGRSRHFRFFGLVPGRRKRIEEAEETPFLLGGRGFFAGSRVIAGYGLPGCGGRLLLRFVSAVAPRERVQVAVPALLIRILVDGAFLGDELRRLRRRVCGLPRRRSCAIG